MRIDFFVSSLFLFLYFCVDDTVDIIILSLLSSWVTIMGRRGVLILYLSNREISLRIKKEGKVKSKVETMIYCSVTS